jgi:hypothetical protein
MALSGYSAQGFEDEEGKVTTSFEANIPEARDPATFPDSIGSPKEAPKTPSSPKEEETKSQDGRPYTSAGFPADTKHEAVELDKDEEPKYTAEGFVGDKEEGRKGGSPRQ